MCNFAFEGCIKTQSSPSGIAVSRSDALAAHHSFPIVCSSRPCPPKRRVTWISRSGAWAEVEGRLRAEERAWDEAHRESRDDFISRLRRVAKATPMANVEKTIGDLSWRAKALYKTKVLF